MALSAIEQISSRYKAANPVRDAAESQLLEDAKAFQVDYLSLRRAFARALRSNRASFAELEKFAADRLLERLDLLKSVPTKILILGAGPEVELICRKFSSAKVTVADWSLERVAAIPKRAFWQSKPLKVQFEADGALPFANSSFDLIFANLLLPWVYPARQFVTELNRVLEDGAGFFLSAAGPDTLGELRLAWQSIDTYPHVNALPDMHELGDLLIKCGLADPVVDTQRLSVSYSSTEKFFSELRGLGYVNALQGRRRGLYGSDVRRRLGGQLERCCRRDATGALLFNLELVFAHGWSAKPRTGQNTGAQTISLDRLRDFRRNG